MDNFEAIMDLIGVATVVDFETDVADNNWKTVDIDSS